MHPYSIHKQKSCTRQNLKETLACLKNHINAVDYIHDILRILEYYHMNKERNETRERKKYKSREVGEGEKQLEKTRKVNALIKISL